MTPEQRSSLQRRRLITLVAFLLLAVIVLLIGQVIRSEDGRNLAPAAGSSSEPAARTHGSQDAPAVPEAGTGAPTTRAVAGRAPADAADTTPVRRPGVANAFTFATGYGPVLGTSGTLRRFKVAVARALAPGNGRDFAAAVDRTLGDPRSWIAARRFRLQRVPAVVASEFTVYLASAPASERMCAAGGLRTAGYTSCRLPGQVIINQDRWLAAVPDYGAPLATYRAYAINHEVGHQFGRGHEGCPGRGKPAPVMQQQTYGLRGCVANSWPYLGGKRYAGRPVP